MIPGTTAIVIGNVGNVREHIDRRGHESVLVELTTPVGPIVLTETPRSQPSVSPN